MFKLVLTSFIIISSANAFAFAKPPPPQPPTKPPGYSVVTPELGNKVVKNLMENYYDTRANCGASHRSSYLCSGVTLRGTQPGNYHVWEPSPSSEKSGGVSFSYLRTDAKFSRLAYGYKSGFTIYPTFELVGSALDLEYLCFFPVDADTNRRGDAGCGAHTSYQSSSGECNAQGIYTEGQWVNHYNSTSSNGDNRDHHQCGFNIQYYYPNATEFVASNFYQGLQAMRDVSGQTHNKQNEIRIKTWDKSLGRQTPVQAFFYIDITGQEGLNEARSYQQDFYNMYGLIKPVVKLDLPATWDDEAKFTFSMDDQGI
ncbi:halovibrin HvnB [Aliivibrio fischeri]|uniref:Halovibrin HvnB n=2 Tax=Aliivibrio fischeri TaxID=668 RepID=Q5E182_ALIF1|nr:halovibrin HvnB [Aliivibrio fischeri]AAG42285.1 HvnB [Aliivibrio fischeri ES114]AAW87214.1 halovibrin HvnB [Aliivibrio fischeri ES114]KLU80856.1 halovibrin HvnB [Aliivibrio fischeri]MBP3139493.1 halovibrin HvnB [Aliivibrio fischeri]MBP3155083.1 halovibrin HvnB [Aliivibrio fischeri]